MLDKLEFIIMEALTALRRNGMMTISAVNTAAIALFILGGLGYAYLNLNEQLKTIPAKLELTISAAPNTTSQQLHDMALALRQIEGVKKVVLLPKDAEWSKYRKSKGIENVTKDIPNPLPDQFAVTLADLKKADEVKERISRVPNYYAPDKIRDPVAKRRQITAYIDFIRWSAVVLGAITFFTAGLLILNSVHLTVLARRQEIRIMRLVGASHATIRLPFILEGAFQGLLGGILGGLMLWALSAYMRTRSIQVLGALEVGKDTYPALRIISALAVSGILLGMLAAGLSIRRYLRMSR